MPYCPKCGRKFRSEFQVTQHLGQPFSLCAKVERTTGSKLTRVQWTRNSHQDDQLQDVTVQTITEDEHDFPDGGFGWNASDIPVLNPSEMPTPHCHITVPSKSDPFVREEFIGAAKTYGRGSTIMDEFDADAHARNCETNIFYPFASWQDWELALFLLSSGMSMARIDQFLGLELVCNTFGCAVL